MPPKKKAKAKAEESPRMEFCIRGKNYSIAPGDLNAIEARDYRREMGESFAHHTQLEDIDIDVIATLVWLVDRRTNPAITWEAVAEAITYDDLREIEVDVEASEDPSSSGRGS